MGPVCSADARMRGVCRLTCIDLSPTLVPCSAWMERSAEPCSAKLTKPTPRHWPLCGSVSTFTDRMAPKGENFSYRKSLSASGGRFCGEEERVAERER